MMINLLDDSNFHRQTAVKTRLIEMIIQNPISMLAHSNEDLVNLGDVLAGMLSLISLFINA
jgi:uncharacterized protein YbgA (DUF1722 family)